MVEATEARKEVADIREEIVSAKEELQKVKNNIQEEKQTLQFEVEEINCFAFLVQIGERHAIIGNMLEVIKFNL